MDGGLDAIDGSEDLEEVSAVRTACFLFSAGNQSH